MTEHFYWGAPTSRLNFGEPDYLTSTYVAETYNTFSNFGFVALGLLGAVAALRARQSSPVVLAHLSMAVTGVASALFHATLQFGYHMFDEIAESWMVLFIVYLLLDRRFRWPQFLAHGLAMSVLIYHVMGFCEVHLIAMALYTLRTIPGRMEQCVSASVSATYSQAIVFLLMGVATWLLDIAFAPVIAAKQVHASTAGSFDLDHVGWRLIQLHAFWHILMAIGVYLVTLVVSMLCTADADKVRLAPSGLGFVAYSK
jgi:dihydroceramidase